MSQIDHRSERSIDKRKNIILRRFAIILLFVIVLPMVSLALGDKIDICHHRGNEKNPYTLLNIPLKEVVGHLDHPYDIIPAPSDGCPNETINIPSPTPVPPVVPSPTPVPPVVHSPTPVPPVIPSPTPVPPVVHSPTPVPPVVPSPTPISPVVPSPTPISPVVPGTTLESPVVPGTTLESPAVPSPTPISPVVPGTTLESPVVPGTTLESPVAPDSTRESLVVPSPTPFPTKIIGGIPGEIKIIPPLNIIPIPIILALVCVVVSMIIKRIRELWQ